MGQKKKRRPGEKVAYFNRELSWLAFNRRVLDQASNESYPLLERLRYLSFVSSNLDEFFEIRVAGLIQQVDSGVVDVGLDGLGPKEQLRRIHNITNSLVSDQYKCWHKQLVPQLKAHNIEFKSEADLGKREMRWIKSYFEEQVFPVITPLAIDPSHPFPQIGNKTLNILVWLEDASLPDEDPKMAIIPVPRILPQIVSIGDATKSEPGYMFLSDIVKIFAKWMFPGFQIKSATLFRITRNSDLYIDEEEVVNLLQTIEEELYKLRKGAAVRLEIEKGVDDALLDQLLDAISLSQEYTFKINGPLNLFRLMSAYDLVDRPDLKFKPFIPYTPPALQKPETIFDTLSREDFILHHPYDSFNPVIEFIQQATEDPDVLAIKLTLYRAGSDSQIIKALAEASRNGTQVTALIELKARFDEEQNIHWAKQLEEAGVHVVYGIVGMKTHCKCCLVVRREGEELKRYVHLGTGNYNPKTARQYTDLSAFTSRREITSEVASVFNILTGFTRAPEFKHLLVAPYNLHSAMQQYILREAENARKGKSASIIFKGNSLVDKETIDNLYLASQAGVQIDLIIRGICCLVPNVKGLSENIRVRSILGRFLEHSRIYYFENDGGDSALFAGSADWMPHNSYRRIEVVYPIPDPKLRKRLLDDILKISLKDNTNATTLRSNGSYVKVPCAKNDEPFACQNHFIQEAENMRVKSESEQE